MSSLLTVYGTIAFPKGALARWLEAALVVDDDDDVGEESVFDAANDLASVREVLADVGDCWPFMRLVLEGDALLVRAALGDDDWSRWCGRLRALAGAAARLGARGKLVCEEEFSYAGALVIRGGRATYVASGAAPVDLRGAAEMRRLLDEALAPKKPEGSAKQAAKKVAGKKVAGKKVAQPDVAKKGAVKKVAGKEAAKQVARRGAAKKAAVKQGAVSRAARR